MTGVTRECVKPTALRASRLAAIVGGVSTGHEFLPPNQYVASLARKRITATAFFRDEEGRVLLVNPVYKPAWDLPGGAAEADESPHAACRREVAEELGLDRPPGRLVSLHRDPRQQRQCPRGQQVMPRCSCDDDLPGTLRTCPLATTTTDHCPLLGWTTVTGDLSGDDFDDVFAALG